MQALAKIFVIFFILLPTTSAFGQDIHYSQYFNNPLILNPAETGNFEGDWRGIANYRNQWSSLGIPFKTLSASYDQQLYYKKYHFSPGISVLTDNSGNSLLKINMIYASCAYHQVINKNSLSFGIQLGLVLKNIDFGKLTFPDEFDISTPDNLFNPETKPTSVIGNDNVTFLDVNIGAAWKRKINRYEPEVGISFFHLNNPKESFFDDKEARRPIRSTLYAAVKTELSPTIYVKPGILLFSLRGSSDMMMGSQIGYKVPGNSFNVSEAYGGIYLRNGIFREADAMMVLLGAQVHSLNINISYDINVSSLSSYTNHRGAIEISLIFRSISTVIKTFTIPCERI